MNVHRSHLRLQRWSRARTLQILLTCLGLWITTANIGCYAMPHPKPQTANSISKIDDSSYVAEPPLLIPNQPEVVLDLNTDFVMHCEDIEPIEWKFPTDSIAEEGMYEPEDTNRPFGRTLTIKAANYMSVGYYYCIKTSKFPSQSLNIEDAALNDLTNNNLASSIYVYVNDTENLLAPMPFPVIHVVQFQNVIIPCKPSMPDVDVLLTTPSGTTLSSDGGSSYHPQMGFQIEIRSIKDCNTYYCRPKNPARDNEEEYSSIDIILANAGRTPSTSPGSIATLLGLVTNQNVVHVTNRPGPRVYETVVPAPFSHRKAMDVGVGHVNVFYDESYSTIKTTTTTTNGAKVDVDVGDGVSIEEVEGVAMPGAGTTPRSTTPSRQDYYYEDDIEELSNANSDYDNSLRSNLRVIRGVDTTTRASMQYDLYSRRSTPRSKTDRVDHPIITSNTKNHATVGDTFQLSCLIKVIHDVTFKYEWILPPGIDMARVSNISNANTTYTANHTFNENILVIRNAQKSDSGKYTCRVTDHSDNSAKTSYSMLVMGKNESYLNISEPNGFYTLDYKANSTINLAVRYAGYPAPTLEWYRPDGTKLSPGSHHRYVLNTTERGSSLSIPNAHLLDSGIYTVNATNGPRTKALTFTVSVHDKPIVALEDTYVHAGEKVHLQCHVKSHMKPLVTWAFQPCTIEPRWPSCKQQLIQDFNETSSHPGETALDFIFNLHFVPTYPGIIHCEARNNISRALAKAHILIRDIEDNVTVSGVNDRDVIALGDEVTITCAAVAYYFTNDLEWYDQYGEYVRESPDIKIRSWSSDYSYKKSITFKHIRDSDQGAYECRANYINNDTLADPKFIHIIAHEPLAPRITKSNLGDNLKIERKLGESLELYCESHAIPNAVVTWFKDDVELENVTSNSIAHMIIPYMKPEDQGHYKCIVSNRLGVVEQTVTVKITNIPGLTLGWIALILFVLLALIGLVIYLCIRIRRERKLLRELKAAGLDNFEKGAMEHINPALTLDEQADLLPYDRCFEFPREKLKLGKQLGAGAFGVVLKAHAEGIKLDEKESVVAVKMVKRSANNEVMRALVSELKIMVHLGQHLNVVNLLGAVTKNIAKRELMVIVEYCRYGNVQNFLMRNRKRFINQIHPQTGKIDPTILTQRFSDNFELDRNSENDPRSGTRAGRPGSTGYLSQSEFYEGQVNTCATEQTVMTTVPEDDDNIMSNNSVQPAWRSNYKPDSTEAMAVTTTDLISWAFQVTCGMEYLSSKKVLHGDLAARNILLCEDNIVKICDFGLARSMYKSDNYKKQGDAPLPIKWLALESLSDHIFSTYTDVWSFGIVLWELFSLAKVPYPEIDANQSLYLKLKDGYRMEKPLYANDDLYDIMLECWSTNPECRPLFHVLKERFAALLGEEVTNHYVDLNEPYLRVNSEYMKRNQTDYLSLMGAPDEMAPPPPKYVNGHILPEIRIDLSSDDYLQMSPNGDSVIFSPTRPKDSPTTTVTDENADHPPNISTTSFKFPDRDSGLHSPTLANNLDSPSSKVPRIKKDGFDPLPEEIPMLQNSQVSEDSPQQQRKYGQILQQTRGAPTPSPRHHIAETKLADEGDNYVNVKAKNGLNNNSPTKPEAFSNPSYQIIKASVEGRETH